MRSFRSIAKSFAILDIFFVLLSIVRCNEFSYCIRDNVDVKSSSKLKECVGRQALNFLQRIEDSENFSLLRGLSITKDEKAERSVGNVLDQDPVDFRGIFENAGVIISNRALQWNLHGIHPGLQMRIGPSADTTSVLEFTMDPQVNERNYLSDDPSTARILSTKLLVPFLLGLKFNLVAIVPLIFGAIIFLCQKAAILAKLALFLSTIFGVGGALGLGALGATTAGGENGGFFGGIGNYGFGGHGPGLHHHHHPLKQHGFSSGVTGYSSAEPQEYDGYIRNDRRIKFDHPREYTEEEEQQHSNTPIADRFYDYEKNILLQDRQYKVFERHQPPNFGVGAVNGAETTPSNEAKNRKNFVWKAI